MRTAQPSSQNPISRDFQNVVDDAHELLKTVEQEGTGKMNQVRTKVQDSLETAKAKLGEVGTQVQESAKQYAESAKQYANTTDEYVRANPWQAVGVGALAGAVLGFLIARR
jgi:ElaB protein